MQKWNLSNQRKQPNKDCLETEAGFHLHGLLYFVIDILPFVSFSLYS